MLSMLMMIPPKKRGALAKQWRRFIPPPVNACLATVENVPFIRITCEEHSKGLDWRMIAAHSLECSDRILMPAELLCPAESGLRRFRPTVFIRRMMENLALEVLINISAQPSQKSIALYGSEAETAQLLPRVIPLAGEIRIITRRGYALKDIVDDLIRKTGASITLTDEPDAGGCMVLIAPFGGAGFIKTDDKTVIIAPDRPLGSSAAWVNGVSISLPSVLEEVYDPQYDTAEFTGAFYELAGMRSLARISPDYGTCSGSTITAKELSELIYSS